MLFVCVCSVRVRLSSQHSDIGAFAQDEKFLLFCEPDEPDAFSRPHDWRHACIEKLDISDRYSIYQCTVWSWQLDSRHEI